VINRLTTIVIASVLQLHAQTLIPRIGALSSSLGVSEIGQIQRIATAANSQPWLVRDSFCDSGFSCLTLYLEPDSRSRELWRGRALRLHAQEPPLAPSRSEWRISTSFSYAYAPDHDQTWPSIAVDRSRPFGLGTEIDDKTLIGLIRFLRGNPRAGLFQPRLKFAELSWIERTQSGFKLTFSDYGGTGYAAVAKRRFGRWWVRGFHFWAI
jgi:hypothetical protein